MYGSSNSDDGATATGAAPTTAHDVAGGVAGLDSSAAMLRAESDHLDATLRALVARLSSVPGLAMTVSHRHGRLRRLIGDLPYVNDLNRSAEPIDMIAVSVGSDCYWLRSDDGSIRCGKESTPSEPWQAGGELSFSAWATALFDEVASQNIAGHESILALRELVEHDRLD